MINSIKLLLAKKLMKLFPFYPTFENIPYNWEIFQHKNYTQASKVEKKKIRKQSAQNRYDYEIMRGLFDTYFPQFKRKDFLNSSILEIGSFTGGSLVQWTERYGFSNAQGIDINQIFAKAGNEFAKQKEINVNFKTGFGEKLPYKNDSFDYVVNFDVLEHVKNVEEVLNECFRVLKPGGKLLSVFPQFFQPMEAHLGMVTKTPALHWFFSGKTLTKAYYEIIKERGEDANWYALDSSELSDWERLPTLNGVTVNKFRKIIKSNKSWKIISWSKDPIFSDGRLSEKLFFRILKIFFILPARLPILEELFLGRICCVLKKNKTKQS